MNPTAQSQTKSESQSEKRASLSKDFQSTCDVLQKHFPSLCEGLDAAAYASVYFERKKKKRYEVDLRQRRVSDSTSSGVVLRIYDGYSLFEQATDDFSEPTLLKAIERLQKRVADSPRLGECRPYDAPTWADRLARDLDPEIRSQIPSKTPSPSERVHFGVRYEQDPFDGGDAAWVERAQEWLERFRSCAKEVSLKPEDITYARVSAGITLEEAFFMDRESILTQALYRPVTAIQIMSGEARTYLYAGGIGGTECLHIEDCDVLSTLRDLRALRNPERLTPGKYRVLFSPGLAGVLAHEAFGHSQEGDTCARGRSKAWDLSRTGELVGNEQATILNSPAIYRNGTHSFGAWGSYFFDEEGWLAQTQVLLDRGRLKDPMTSLTSSIRLGVPRTSNGKRESWSHGVYTRQTNTYFSPGDRTYQQMLELTGDGYLGTRAAGGMEDPKGMGIQVGILYLHEVKGGKLTGRVFRGPSGGDIQMTGYTPDVLGKIVAKSKIDDRNPRPDRAIHPHIEVGGCGKYHKEVVQAGCGGPYLLLDQVVLG